MKTERKVAFLVGGLAVSAVALYYLFKSQRKPILDSSKTKSTPDA